MADQLSFGLIITDPQAAKVQAMRGTRKCLSCLRQFNSEGPGNRICLKCKDLDAWKGPNQIAVVSYRTATF